jgi:hypothetical protein
MTNQELLTAIAQGLAQVSAPLVVHQQIGQIIEQAQKLITKDQEPTKGNEP